MLNAHSPITLSTLSTAKPLKAWQQKIFFLDVTPKFLDVIVVKREGKYKNIGSFTLKHRIFYLKTSDLLPKNIRSFYAKGKGK